MFPGFHSFNIVLEIAIIARIPLTSVQMVRSRQANFRQYRGSGTFRNLPMYAVRYDYPDRQPPKWRRIFIAIVIIVIIILLLALLLGSLLIRLQAYTSFTNTTEVAQVTVLKSREGNDQLSIRLTRFDANGNQVSDKSPYLIQGDKLQLKYEYIICPSRLGLRSGYILTDLEGYYKDGTPGTSLPLNKADEDNSLPAQVDALVASPKYGSITLMPSRSIYRVYISQAGQLYFTSYQG